MTVENGSRSNSTKGWDRARFKLTTTGCVIGLTTDCATWPGHRQREISNTLTNNRTSMTLVRIANTTTVEGGVVYRQSMYIFNLSKFSYFNINMA